MDFDYLLKPHTEEDVIEALRKEDRHLVFIDTDDERGIEIEDPTGFKRLYPVNENTAKCWKILAYQLGSKTWVSRRHMYKLMCIALEKLEEKNK